MPKTKRNNESELKQKIEQKKDNQLTTFDKKCLNRMCK